MWLEGVHRGLHMKVECIRCQEGICCSICPANVVLKLLGSLLGYGRTVVMTITQVLNSPTVFLIMTLILAHCIKRGKEIHMKLSMQNGIRVMW
jgi:hypothetical protein